MLYKYIRENNFRAFFESEIIFTTKIKPNYGTCINETVSKQLCNGFDSPCKYAQRHKYAFDSPCKYTEQGEDK